jgi:hypothetical protein
VLAWFWNCRPAGVSVVPALFVSDKERAAELLFQRVNAGAHRGLGHMEPLRGADEVPRRNDGEKRSGQFRIHGQHSRRVSVISM